MGSYLAHFEKNILILQKKKIEKKCILNFLASHSHKTGFKPGSTIIYTSDLDVPLFW